MPALEAEVFDVGAAGLGDTEAIESEQHRQRGVIAIEPLGGKQERAELPAVHASALVRLHFGSADVLSRVRWDAPVDVREPVEAAHRGEPSVDRRRREAPFLHR